MGSIYTSASAEFVAVATCGCNFAATAQPRVVAELAWYGRTTCGQIEEGGKAVTPCGRTTRMRGEVVGVGIISAISAAVQAGVPCDFREVMVATVASPE